MTRPHPATVQKTHDRRYRGNHTCGLVEFLAVALTDSRKPAPVRRRPEMMFLVVPVIEGQQVVKTPVMAHRVREPAFGYRTVMPVVVLHVHQCQGEENRWHITEQHPLLVL